MGVEPIIMWQVVCDRCGHRPDEEIVAWTDKSSVSEAAPEWFYDGDDFALCANCESDWLRGQPDENYDATVDREPGTMRQLRVGCRYKASSWWWWMPRRPLGPEARA